MSRHLPDKFAPVPEQAAEWLVELAEPELSEGSRRAFMSWLKESPRHIEEFLQVAALQQDVSGQRSSIAEIMAELEAAGTGTLTLPAATKALPGQRQAAPARRNPLLWIAAAGVVLAALLLLELPREEAPLVTHRTGIGEQRSIVLGDGSIVTLNTQSEAAVRFDDSVRRVDLVAGVALFDVARDSDRVFVVRTGGVSFAVVGTRFSVYRRQSSTTLAVVEGEVRAVSDVAPDEPVFVRAGQGAVATAAGISPANPEFDIAEAIAWTERRLVFDGAALAEVVGEFNRYNRVPLVIEDSALASRAITSVFHAHDVSALVGFLELEPDVEVERGDDAIRIRVRK